MKSLYKELLDLLDSVDKLYLNRKYNESIQLLTRAEYIALNLEKKDYLVEIFNTQGNINKNLGNYNPAKLFFEKALKILEKKEYT